MGYYSCCFFFYEFPPHTSARLFPSLIGTSSVPGAHFFHTTGQPLRLKPFPSTFESIKNQFYWRNSIKKSRFFSLSLSRAQTQFNQLCSLSRSVSLCSREVSCFTRFSWKNIVVTLRRCLVTGCCTNDRKCCRSAVAAAAVGRCGGVRRQLLLVLSKSAEKLAAGPSPSLTPQFIPTNQLYTNTVERGSAYVSHVRRIIP